MTLRMFTVYDSKAEAYLHPFTMLTTQDAVRGFTTVLNVPDSQYALYPADFTLFEIGTFDPGTGKIDVYPSYENLGNGLHLKPQGTPPGQNPAPNAQEALVQHKLNKKTKKLSSLSDIQKKCKHKWHKTSNSTYCSKCTLIKE